jgi:hypothetical protein
MKEIILTLIVVGPLLVNLLLIFIAQRFFLGKKSLLSMLVVMYLLLNGLLPILIGEHLIDQADENYHRELLALVLIILMFRMIDIFGFGLGKIFKEIWNYK